MKKALGKGLNALLPSPPQGDESAVVELDVGKIEPNPEQPRSNFDGDALRQLAESIASVGVVQPIIVSDEGAYYKIIAGERRWRAARLAGLATIPAIVRKYSKERGVEVALIENLQRQDLNPVEEANGYERLITEYGYTQEKIARTVGKSRPAVANAIRLLKLSSHIKELLSKGAITPGHARALLSIESEERRDTVADNIVERDLNVRQSEVLAGREAAAADEPPESDKRGANGGGGVGSGGSDSGEREVALKRIEDELRTRFNTRVSLSGARGKAGKIVIEYYGDEELQRLLEQFGIGGMF